MLKRILFCLSVMCVSGEAVAQVEIDDLAAPTSPAFVLLDVSPASVERPETPKQFTVNLLGKLTSSDGLPRNYALEVAPYWLLSHPTLTFAEYQNPTVSQSIAQTLAISVATVPIPGATTGDDPTGTRLGLGFRVSLVNGRANPRVETLIEELEAVNFDILDMRQAAKKPGAPANDTKLADALAEASRLALQIQAADAERIGLFVTVAGGQAWAFSGDTFENAVNDKRGLWVTTAYRWRGCAATEECESSFDAIGVARALGAPDIDTAWDIGGRLVWKATKELNLSFEALRRRGGTAPGTEDADSNRTVGLLQYRIREDLILVGSFGQDFTTLTGEKPLVSLLGLNIGFGDKAVVQPVARRPEP
jgi:hypothetical protein